MPLIRGRYYVNPAYGRAMERARGDPPQAGARGHEAEPRLVGGWEDAHEPPRLVGAGRGVHSIHIQRHAEGVRVHLQHHGPASDDEHDAPSGHWCTHNFDCDDHEGVGRFVASALAHPGPAEPSGTGPNSPGNR